MLMKIYNENNQIMIQNGNYIKLENKILYKKENGTIENKTMFILCF